MVDEDVATAMAAMMMLHADVHGDGFPRDRSTGGPGGGPLAHARGGGVEVRVWVPRRS